MDTQATVKKPLALPLLGVLAVAIALRIAFAWHLPLNGDECISVLQATGHAAQYHQNDWTQLVPASQAAAFLDYSPDHGLADVLDSMESAGMHPPLYYLLLHYVIRFLGSDAFTLRMVATVFSLAGLVCLACLARRLTNARTALLATLLLAVSGFDVWLGTKVRPYPIVMCLALLTSLQACHLHQTNRLTWRSGFLYLYLLAVIAGLYSLYHFAFVFAFQLIFLLIPRWRQPRAWCMLVAIGLIVAAALLPWLNYLRTHLHVITGGDGYYFSQSHSLARFVGDVASLTFFRFYRIPSETIKAVLAAVSLLIAGSLCLVGWRRLRHSGPTQRAFAVAFVAYFVVYIGVERIVGINTFNKEKMLFFVIPILFFCLARGLRLVPAATLRTALIVFVTLALLANSLAGALGPGVAFGSDEDYLLVFPPVVQRLLPPDRPALLLINTPARRYLAPFLHATAPIDVQVALPDAVDANPPWLDELSRHDRVLLANFAAESQTPRYSPEQQTLLHTLLLEHGFSLAWQDTLHEKDRPKHLAVFFRADESQP